MLLCYTDQSIDLEALLELDNNGLKDYLPLHGDRLKFLKQQRNFKEQAGGVEVLLLEKVASHSDSQAFEPAEESTSSTSSSFTAVPPSMNPSSSSLSQNNLEYCDLVLKDTLVESALAKLNVLEILRKDTVCLKAIEKLCSGQRPTGDWRNRIVDVLVTTGLLHISEDLSLTQLKSVAGEIVKCLPGEQLETYYLDADPPLRKFVGGKLVDKYRNRKRSSDDPLKPAKRRRGAQQQQDTPPPPTTSEFMCNIHTVSVL
ncbi:uncharacterized protein LOC127749474 [Frankliniella occidentalis]|uniref:Uncharacterized protein LOC127749474 n=1 Tax=Frankliniella occidentalis TaxID=133901 RepID=A0A9C6WW43_FRAOC|nr:uncharacterized protein LOC127749474 [Frankliniella occidentalis]